MTDPNKSVTMIGSNNFIQSIGFALLIFFHCEAAVADHFKKALGKSDIHRMKNIDFIYMINLDQRPEKFEKCINQLHPFGIYPYRFSAVNGWELTIEAINDVGVKFAPGMNGGFMATSYLSQDNFQPFHEPVQTYGQTYFCHCMARGTIGIVLSHLSVLQDALDSGYETIWVMEDDIEVIRYPRDISDLIDKLDRTVSRDRWDILFTDQDIKDANGNYIPSYGFAKRPNFIPSNEKRYYVRKKVSKEFMFIGSRFGATSMIVRRSGMQKILDFIKQYKIFLPYDMDNYMPESIRMYSVIDDVVSNQPKAISDNGG